MDAENLFEKLIKAEDEADVEHILDTAGYSLANEKVWVPLGGMENNFSTVGNQQTEPTAALVEKIINGIDAALMAECYRRGIDPESSSAPQSMSEAVEQFFGVKGGRLEDLVATEQTGLADNIHVVAVGQKTSPCYLIVDRGEGQTPTAFPDTFLSLNRSNKLRIPFVQGKFNAGGTGVLQFCGERNIRLIVSRRHPEAVVSPGDKTKDLWGFTIIRRMKPTAGRRSSMYVYLAPNGKVPNFKADTIKVLPQKRKNIQPAPYAAGLSYGTCVKLYNFRWRAKSIATTESRYELERYLHSPCLPFRLTETRDYKANYFSTTIAGVWVTVASAGDDAESAKVEPGFPAYAELKLIGVGELPYRIVVFGEGIETGPGPAVPYVGKKFPSKFRLTKNPADGLVKHCPINRTCRIEFETDAVNDYFKRSDCPGQVHTEPSNLIEQSHLWNGRWVARFRVPWDAKPGDKITVAVTVSDVETDKRGAPFVSTFTLIAAEEAETPPPPPGPQKPHNKGNGKKTAQVLAIPKISEVRKEEWEKRIPPYTPYTALEVKHDADGGYDFFVNVDNAFLLTEMTRAKDSDRPLVKFWFKYGLALCAMGMLQEQKRGSEAKKATDNDDDAHPSENDEGDGDAKAGEDLPKIGAYCSGVGRVIIPIIRTLYRPPQPAA